MELTFKAYVLPLTPDLVDVSPDDIDDATFKARGTTYYLQAFEALYNSEPDFKHENYYIRFLID